MNMRQIDCQKMPDRMSKCVANRMPESMSCRMPNQISDRIAKKYGDHAKDRNFCLGLSEHSMPMCRMCLFLCACMRTLHLVVGHAVTNRPGDSIRLGRGRGNEACQFCYCLVFQSSFVCDILQYFSLGLTISRFKKKLQNSKQ